MNLKELNKEFFRDYREDLEKLSPELIALRIKTLQIRIQTLKCMGLTKKQEKAYFQLCKAELKILQEYIKEKELGLDKVS